MGKTEILKARTTPEFKARINAACAQRNRDLSQAITEGLELWINNAPVKGKERKGKDARRKNAA